MFGVKGEKFARAHHFDNAGALPAKVKPKGKAMKKGKKGGSIASLMKAGSKSKARRGGKGKGGGKHAAVPKKAGCADC